MLKPSKTQPKIASFLSPVSQHVAQHKGRLSSSQAACKRARRAAAAASGPCAAVQAPACAHAAGAEAAARGAGEPGALATT